MRKLKVGAELSVNVIIIAVLALLVLVVLFAVFTGRMNIFNLGIKNLETCPSNTQKVESRNDCDGTIVGYMVEKDSTTNKVKTYYCCSK
ncbi:MAG: hypothetical protein ACPLWC_05245 [Candidatus Woesearchaeota archaeon]